MLLTSNLYRRYLRRLLFLVFLFVSLAGEAQSLHLSVQRASLATVFSQIERQCDYQFLYTEELLAQSFPVSFTVQYASLDSVLQLCFRQQPLDYTKEGKHIIVRKKIIEKPIPTGRDVRGKIVNEQGDPLPGVLLRVKNSSFTTATDVHGEFIIPDASEMMLLIITGAELETQEIIIGKKSDLSISMKTKIGELDQVVMMAYGQTTRRVNTGNIAKITPEEISQQPVSNPLVALEGRIAGLQVTQSSGINGAGIKIQLRGQNSLIQGTEPFFIIDGVPFAPGNTALNQISNSTNTNGLSPFNLINPLDIESIEVLKDADATAIYGSRGANGVIIITTKKGKAGKASLQANLYTGSSRVTRTVDLLNTQQYLMMRNEAFKNDGILPTTSTAPDLLLWDTTRYTDLKKLFTGGTAHTSDAELSYSGGSTNTQFFIGGGFHRETTVLPTDLADQRASVHFNLSHQSSDKRASIHLTTSYSLDNNKLSTRDLTAFISLPPNIKLYDSLGNINWKDGNVFFSSALGDYGNPLAGLKTSYTGEYQNLSSSLQTAYKVTDALQLTLNLGYHAVQGDEVSINPSTSIDPSTNLLPFSNFGNSSTRQWIIEPQAEFTRHFAKNKVSVLAGSTWQANQYKSVSVNGADYPSDLLLNSIAGAGSVTATNSFRQYRYQALFARFNYTVNQKYIWNITGRRDGSSRFGSSKQFANFGAAGFAWLFSEENFSKKLFPFISFGKIRMSYGITGSDQIGDYKYLDTWTAVSTTYQGIPILNPSALYNPDYSWEVNKKFESAFDLGILKDRILFSLAYFNNHCSNQIIQYSLPIQTGFTSVGKNLDATIRNAGFEFTLNSKNIVHQKLTWSSSFNLTISRNRLLAFPGLATSTYSNTYSLGQPLSARKYYEYTGLDSNGIYQYTDVNKDGKLDINDKIIFNNTDPTFYGGLLNTLSYHQFKFDVFFEFKKQDGLNYINSLNGYVPGYDYHNQPVAVLQRWQQPGDITNVQRFTATFTSAARKAGANLPSSSAVFSDASYIRCKNISLSYRFPEKMLRSLHLSNGQVFLRAQNLFIITRYEGADPETQNMYTLPPLRTIAAGFNLNF